MELLLNLLKWSIIVGTAALALTLLKPLLDKRYSAKWRCGAWLVMAVFLLLAPVRWGGNMPQAPVAPAVVIEVPKVDVSVSREDGVSFQRPEAVKRPVANIPAGPAARAKTFPLEELLITLWATGGALFLLYHGLGTWFFTRRAKRWSRCADGGALRIYDAVCRDMKLKRAPALRVSSAVDSPMMVGLFRPRLLLPAGDFEELELTFILRHELTHHRRHDLWYKLLLTLANALHWFNPLVYLMRREAERDLELTCDDAVVAGSDAAVRRAYSETLLASVHRQKGLGRAVLSTHFYGGKEVMKERFRNILGKQGRKRGILVLAAVLLATLAAACAFGLQTSTDGELAPEELAEWQEKIESREMEPYIYKMYSDRAYLTSDEKLDEIHPIPESEKLGHDDINPKVLSGTKSGDTVTLEIEGNFCPRLPSGTLTLVDGEPASFTTPLYTAVEAEALALMDHMADIYISWAAENEEMPGTLEFTEKCITNLFCAESIEIGDKTYYIWNLYYAMKPNDESNVMLAGGMDMQNGWLTQSGSVGDPIIIASIDADGNAKVEEQEYTSTTGETGFTWEEYVTCHTDLGMGMGGVLNGWPELTTPFLESLRDGHDTWALDWQDTALSYLSSVYDVYPESGLTELKTFTADENTNDHDQAILVQGKCGNRTVTLLLAHVCYPVEVWDTTIRFWQVVGEKWEPDAPEKKPEASDAPGADPDSGEVPLPEDTQARPLSELEMVSVTSYFNVAQHNGLLRFPYDNLGDVKPYLEILFYDMGLPITDEEELADVAELFGGSLETDCTKLPRDMVQLYLYENIAEGTGNTIWLGTAVVEGTDPGSIGLPYLEKYDSYYLYHGDTMMNSYSFDRGEWDEDGYARLYYTTDLWQYNSSGELDMLWDQPMCVTVTPHPDGGEGLLIISNQIVE